LFIKNCQLIDRNQTSGKYTDIDDNLGQPKSINIGTELTIQIGHKISSNLNRKGAVNTIIIPQ